MKFVWQEDINTIVVAEQFYAKSQNEIDLIKPNWKCVNPDCNAGIYIRGFKEGGKNDPHFVHSSGFPKCKFQDKIKSKRTPTFEEDDDDALFDKIYPSYFIINPLRSDGDSTYLERRTPNGRHWKLESVGFIFLQMQHLSRCKTLALPEEREDDPLTYDQAMVHIYCDENELGYSGRRNLFFGALMCSTASRIVECALNDTEINQLDLEFFRDLGTNIEFRDESQIVRVRVQMSAWSADERLEFLRSIQGAIKPWKARTGDVVIMFVWGMMRNDAQGKYLEILDPLAFGLCFTKKGYDLIKDKRKNLIEDRQKKRALTLAQGQNHALEAKTSEPKQIPTPIHSSKQPISTSLNNKKPSHFKKLSDKTNPIIISLLIAIIILIFVFLIVTFL